MLANAVDVGNDKPNWCDMSALSWLSAGNVDFTKKDPRHCERVPLQHRLLWEVLPPRHA